MKYEELIILAPCHSLEDFPLYHTGDDAAGLLAAWTALWHPALLSAAQSLPKLERADVPPDDLENRLLVVPTASEGELDPDLPDRAAARQTVLIRGQTQRAPIVEQALGSLDGGDAGIDPEVAADFFSLGFTYLQVELLTRQMRYSSSLDESRFRSELLAAADAAVGHDAQQVRQHLVSCHDALADERNHYYPVDVYLIDLTVVASTTIGDALRSDLAEGHPTNLLISAQTVETISRDEPSTLEAVRRGVEAGQVCLIGGELSELPLPLLSPETALRQLQTGTATYVANLGRSPIVFGRRRFGLTPQLPQLLQQFGFRGALHATLDDGRFPESTQYKTQWEGIGGGGLDALARAPLDAAKPDTFLNLPSQLSESMDMDHVATRCFAHWPGQASTWYQDLRRAARFGAALGKFITLDDYFAETGDTGHHDRFQADVYRSPYLKQSVAGHFHDPISRSVRYWQRRVTADSLRALATLTLGLGAPPDDVRGVGEQLDALCDVIDRNADFHTSEEATNVEDGLSSLAHALTDRMQDVLRGKGGGVTVFNPFSFVRRMAVDSTSLDGDAEAAQPVYASGPSSSGRRLAVVDVPAMGMARIAAVAARPDRAVPNIADQYELRNEFLQAHIDPATGALHSITDYSSRGTRLSQQLALRIAPPKTGQPWIDNKRTVSYSVMAADSIDIGENGSILGEIVTRGRLLDAEGTNLAGFVQRYRLTRGSRVLALEIELDPHVELGPDPWDSYFAC